MGFNSPGQLWAGLSWSPGPRVGDGLGTSLPFQPRSHFSPAVDGVGNGTTPNTLGHGLAVAAVSALEHHSVHAPGRAWRGSGHITQDPTARQRGLLGESSCLWSRTSSGLSDGWSDADTGGPYWRSSQLTYHILYGASPKHLHHGIWDGENQP